ncbi:MAG: hypothetical protein ISR82_01815 [Candidatus Marinimicrobia bacterium]|nr:hypothetical protein [Candidatus Neomarinimicrobiota bacterium]MBL7009942.1 hypothetical protein [Candidatus Neomarinimicrobiota bacterium]MBL7029759.1 hypothetical protein [Candidatus Neomarinimicrobiota bacterium]
MKSIISAILLGIIFISCANEDSSTLKTAEAILIWEGAYEVDGCGFIIEMRGKTYKPKDESKIGAEFMENHKTTVIIEYFLPNEILEYLCGDAPYYQKKEALEIISINKR